MLPNFDQEVTFGVTKVLRRGWEQGINKLPVPLASAQMWWLCLPQPVSSPTISSDLPRLWE